MKASISYKINDDITAYIDGEKVAVCYVTGYIGVFDRKMRRAFKKYEKVEFFNEHDRLLKFCDIFFSVYGIDYDLKYEYFYTVKFSDGVENRIWAYSDSDAITKAENCLNPNPGVLTLGDRVVSQIEAKEPGTYYIARKTWKSRDRVNPRGLFQLKH